LNTNLSSVSGTPLTALQVDCSNGLLSVMQVQLYLPLHHTINPDLLQVMWEQTPTQYDIVIRNVSAAGAVVYNGSASGNNMIGLKLRFP
jgi:hypothetical protein